MPTVQMTLNENLLARVDAAVKKLRTTRSAFTREAMQLALNRVAEQELELKHREGYQRKPAQRGEFDVWEAEHAWGDQ